MVATLSRSAEKLPDATRLGPAHLKVTDLDRAASVWVDLVGLSVLSRGDGTMNLGVGGRVLVSLAATARKEASETSLGLHHVALHLPSGRELARAAGRLDAAGHDFRKVDHVVTQAIYVSDHDGIGIELTLETPHRGRIEVVDGSLCAIAADGDIRPITAPLDFRPPQTEIEKSDLRLPLPAGTSLGHVHLRVRDLDRTNRFYADVIGFKPLLQAPKTGMYDVGTSVRPHIVAFSNWVAEYAQSPCESAAGLDYFTIEVPSREALIRVADRLEAEGVRYVECAGELQTADPDGNRVALVCSE